MFNAMRTHGFNPEDLLLSTIISMPTDNRDSMNYSGNYRGISLSNRFVNCMIMYLLI